MIIKLMDVKPNKVFDSRNKTWLQNAFEAVNNIPGKKNHESEVLMLSSCAIKAPSCHNNELSLIAIIPQNP
jgi:hypothetical protein